MVYGDNLAKDLCMTLCLAVVFPVVGIPMIFIYLCSTRPEYLKSKREEREADERWARQRQAQLATQQGTQTNNDKAPDNAEVARFERTHMVKKTEGKHLKVIKCMGCVWCLLLIILPIIFTTNSTSDGNYRYDQCSQYRESSMQSSMQMLCCQQCSNDADCDDWSVDWSVENGECITSSNNDACSQYRGDTARFCCQCSQEADCNINDFDTCASWVYTGRENTQRHSNTSCPVGTYNNQDVQQSGLNKKDLCKKCPVGQYNDQTNQNSCKNCTTATGGYQNEQGQAVCKRTDRCRAGSYLTLDNCLNCIQGQYQDENGQSTCKNCAAGEYQDEFGQPSSTSCKTCAIGQYSSVGASTCAIMYKERTFGHCGYRGESSIDDSNDCRAGANAVGWLNGTINTINGTISMETITYSEDPNTKSSRTRPFEL
jgi:hypothetical protein